MPDDLYQFDPKSYQHKMLLQNKAWLCRQAGITEEHLTHRLSRWCGPAEKQWMLHYKDTPGAYYRGHKQPSVHQRMMAMAGAFLRSGIDARVMTLSEMLETPQQDLPRVLLLPTFAEVEALPGWKRSVVTEALYRDFFVRKFVVALGSSQGGALVEFVLGSQYICL